MSNLTFKTKTDPVSIRNWLGEKHEKSLCYATTIAKSVSDLGYYVYHHNNEIANIDTWRVAIDLCGWDSATTRTRINKILRDNGIGARVYQSNYEQILSSVGTHIVPDTEGSERVRNFKRAVFTMKAGRWVLTHFNGDYETVAPDGTVTKMNVAHY